jgi:hypothetical protein
MNPTPFIRTLLLALLLATAGNGATAQQFRVVEDTVRINAPDFIGPVSDLVLIWTTMENMNTTS